MFHVKHKAESKIEAIVRILEKEYNAVHLVRQFQNYHGLLLEWNNKLNLVSRKDTENIIEKHFVVSAWLSAFLGNQQDKKMLDLGSGAGFPAVIMAIMNPDSLVEMIDSNKKRTLFLKEVVESLGLNARVYWDRIEDFVQGHRREYDYVFSRAVTDLQQLWQWSADLMNERGSMVALKGRGEQPTVEFIKKNKVTFIVKEPEQKWQSINPGIDSKIILKMERRDERK